MIEHLAELVVVFVACLLAVSAVLTLVVVPALMWVLVDGRADQ